MHLIFLRNGHRLVTKLWWPLDCLLIGYNRLSTDNYQLAHRESPVIEVTVTLFDMADSQRDGKPSRAAESEQILTRLTHTISKIAQPCSDQQPV